MTTTLDLLQSLRDSAPQALSDQTAYELTPEDEQFIRSHVTPQTTVDQERELAAQVIARNIDRLLAAALYEVGLATSHARLLDLTRYSQKED
jgi:hypothetical protein